MDRVITTAPRSESCPVSQERLYILALCLCNPSTEFSEGNMAPARLLQTCACKPVYLSEQGNNISWLLADLVGGLLLQDITVNVGGDNIRSLASFVVTETEDLRGCVCRELSAT